MAVANVAVLNKNNVFRVIQTFILSMSINSKKTAQEYEADIRQFFKIMRNKDIEELTDHDLKVTHQEAQEYQYIMRQKYSANTVNRKISSLRSLYNKLKANDFDVNPLAFDLNKIKNTETNSYDVLTVDEALRMIEEAKKLNNGEEKSLLIELAVMTSIRLEALINLTWANFVEKGDFYLVQVFDKGRKFDEKPIKKDLYHRLLRLKKDNTNKVFSISKRTVERAVKELAKRMGMEDRNITFHSLKKVGVNWILETTGDIVLAAKQGNHSTINTTYKYYVDKKKKYDNYAGLTIGEKPDLNILKQVDIETIIKAISAMSVDVQQSLVNKIKSEMDNTKGGVL